MGVTVVSEDEAHTLGRKSHIERVELRDFDFALIAETFARFDVSLDDLAAVCVAVFDHGDAPPGISDRQFRFDYLDQRLRAKNALSSFAFLSGEVPPIMTRLQAVADSAAEVQAPLIVMDTAPAAILGANFDSQVAARPRKMIVNLGNFHCLAFRLGEAGVEAVFEHHTGEVDLAKLELLLLRLADGSLTHEDVFDDNGHGALVYDGAAPLELGQGGWDVAVSGPRRSMFQPATRLRPHFAVPFGDMMLAGNFGMLAAAADLLPDLAEPIRARLSGGAPARAPWET
jgi:uncharacterized protein (DUF1786 family)